MSRAEGVRAREGRSRGRRALVVPLVLVCMGVTSGCDVQPAQETMTIRGAARPAAVVAEALGRQRQGEAALEARAGGGRAGPATQILFGDLHVHTTFSQDAYLMSLPALGGDGVHPPADACDFARYCANLDFFALTDHAESLRPEHWAISRQSVRACNARAGDPANPDLVALMGFEWTQMGRTPEEHFGHRCLVFPETDDARLPPRPIAASDRRPGYLAMARSIASLRYLDPLHWTRYVDYVEYAEALQSFPVCDDAVPFAERPADCLEIAATPAALHAKLDEWGGEVLEIPHGTAWGVYTPATTTMDKHLAPEHYDGEKMKLVEVMSGHGNSEEYRRWRAFERTPEGERICPAPTPDYLPCCWQAGEIMRDRCEGLAPEECERRVELARRYATEAWTNPTRVFPDAPPEAWLDCGQCRDCFKPSFSYRPAESIQYGMALRQATEPAPGEHPTRFRYGFVASSDEHSGRPGVGYKAVDRALMTDANRSGAAAFFDGSGEVDPQQPQRPSASVGGMRGNDARTQAFLYPGGLAAVHARSRARRDIWEAMQRREVYGTSGPRILLWFDLLNGPGGVVRPMGSEVEMATAPRFEVRAIGSFEPRPGCPDWTREGLPAERIEALCHGECFYPSDERRPIAAIEIVRITPQRVAGEVVDPLIEDPWRRFDCEPSPEGCVARFEDPEFATQARDALYYARALEVARPGLVGDPLRPVRDESGRVVAVDPCSLDDDCLAPVQERAWSSPIFVDHPAGRRTAVRRGAP